MNKAIFLLLAILSIDNLANAQDNDNSWRKLHRGLDFKVKGGYAVGVGDAKGFDMIKSMLVSENVSVNFMPV